MPIDPSVFDKIKTFTDYQKADQAFQLQKALQAQQLQTSDIQNQLQQFQLNRLQSGQLTPEEMVNAKLKLAEINAQNPSIFSTQHPMVLDDILKDSAPKNQSLPIPTPVTPPSNAPINNPGNLRPVGATTGFRQFETPEAGMQALVDDITAKATGKSTVMGDKPPTLRNIIGVYAPTGDNNNPNAYTDFVTKETGLNPDLPVNVADIPTKIAPAMAKFEGNKYTTPAQTQIYHTPISEQGKQLLSNLLPEYASRVQGMIDGNIPLPPPGSLARSGPEGKLANQLYDSALQIDPTLTADRFTTLQKFNHGPEARQIKSFSVGIDHLNTLSDLADALNNGDVKLINSASNAVATQLGKPNANNFEAAKQIVADEIIKAVVGAGGGEGDRQAAQATISAANSPEQLKGVIDTYKKLMGGQLEGMKQQYETGTGRTDFYDRLAPGARAVFNPSQTASSQKINPADAINELKRRGKL